MPMPMKVVTNPRCLVVFLLVLVSSGVTYLVLVVPSGSSKFLGGCLVAFGILTVLLHRLSGRQSLKWAGTIPAFGADLWEHIGEQGAQVLYLGIGVILTAAGSFLLIKSFEGM